MTPYRLPGIPPTTTELLNALAKHQGAHAGISADDLSRRLGCSPRTLRKLIEQLREEGTVICGTPRTGYFVATTPEELRQTVLFLERRALKTLKLLARIKNCGMPTLMGQLLLHKG